MRQLISSVVVAVSLAACGSEGPNAPSGATASFAASARAVPVRCSLPTCPAALPIVVAVRVDETGGTIGGYVTAMHIALRDTATGSVLQTEQYEAAEIRAMTLVESNQVFPAASLEIVAHPSRFAVASGTEATVTVAITTTDYHGNAHHQTLVVPIS
jgi:hypothetical protein